MNNQAHVSSIDKPDQAIYLWFESETVKLNLITNRFRQSVEEIGGQINIIS